MRTYFKAYLLGDLRQFAGWKDGPAPAGVELTDDLVVYLGNDYTVVVNPFADEQSILFASVDDDWRAFCHERLGFEVDETALA
ncbi:MAG: hypothetical protein KatS3mg057_0046 [Herpetosiphonaceae bacterium]|nr:MAG: hypothetical protein KatS3mg057_0046 [Herpetosiphonaceae bacterium]